MAKSKKDLQALFAERLKTRDADLVVRVQAWLDSPSALDDLRSAQEITAAHHSETDRHAAAR